MGEEEEKRPVKIVMPSKGEKKKKKMEDMGPDEVVDIIMKEERGEETDEESEYGVGITGVMKTRLIILAISVVMGVIFFAMASFGVTLDFLNFDYLAWIMLGIMFIIGPISIYESQRISKAQKIEERLADFLRDLGESTHAGLTLAKAVKVASKGEYGELTPEIQKMAVQISWGLPATEALTLFADRLKTPLVKRSVLLVNEANEAGGDVASVLSAASSDTREIQLLQHERSTQMTMYVATIMVAFVVFLVVILIVYNTFVPQMKEMQQNLREASEEGENVGGGVSAFNVENVNFAEITFVYVLSALIQGIGDGLVAGLMQTGKILNGLKYSFIMVLIVFVIYVFAM